ncbi:Agglutinin-like protein 1 precursor [Asimina triloba]
MVEFTYMKNEKAQEHGSNSGGAKQKGKGVHLRRGRALQENCRFGTLENKRAMTLSLSHLHCKVFFFRKPPLPYSQLHARAAIHVSSPKADSPRDTKAALAIVLAATNAGGGPTWRNLHRLTTRRFCIYVKEADGESRTGILMLHVTQHQLPLARIKRIMKSDEDVKMISADAPVLFSKACELFILELTLRSWLHTEENKRRTLQRSDIAHAITQSEVLDFLLDVVPMDEVKDEEDSGGNWGGNESLPYNGLHE